MTIPIFAKFKGKTEISSISVSSFKNLPAVCRKIAASCPPNIFDPRRHCATLLACYPDRWLSVLSRCRTSSCVVWRRFVLLSSLALSSSTSQNLTLTSTPDRPTHLGHHTVTRVPTHSTPRRCPHTNIYVRRALSIL